MKYILFNMTEQDSELYKKILATRYQSKMMYVKYVGDGDSSHSSNRFFYVWCSMDGTMYSGDNQTNGGYDSNLIAAGEKYFIEATEGEYRIQEHTDYMNPASINYRPDHVMKELD